MSIPLVYNFRSVLQRPVSTAMTAAGIALVVAVFIAMLALANGFRAALIKTGSPDNALVLRRGADGELSSGISRDDARLIGASPHVALDASGRPMLSPEIYVVLNIPHRADSGVSNTVARGVNEMAFEVRHNVRITAGRRFESGKSEIIVGRKLAAKFAHTDVGDTLRFSGRDWLVVGQFESGGSAFESEIWGENEQFMPVFRGQVFQAVAFRLKDPAAFDDVKRDLEGDRRLTVDVHRESSFYTDQSRLLGNVLNILGIAISSIMSVGAIFGAVNTMYAAIASRTPEIAVLLTLGFKPRSVLASFLAESAIIALFGGIAGALLALPINGIVTSTTNWASFSEISFAFRVTPSLLVAGVIFALVMGVIGGFFPARRASKLPVVEALR